MRAMRLSGEEVVVTKRRIREHGALIDRDIDFLVKFYQGHRKSHIASMYKVSVRLINRRLKDIPDDVKEGMAKLVHEFSEGSGFIPDAAMDPLRAKLRRAQRAKQRLGKFQASRVG